MKTDNTWKCVFSGSNLTKDFFDYLTEFVKFANLSTL